MQKALKIGWIGTGVMGNPMAGHLIKNGYTLSVYNRTKSKTDSLVAAGATFKDPNQIAKESDVLALMLGFPHDLENMLFKKEQILKDMKPGSILIDHTTSSPSLARVIYEEAQKIGVKCIDAPVSGGDIGAKNGKLVAMIGGEKDAVESMKPIFDCYCGNIAHMGGAGKGQQTKMANQIMICSAMMGMCEGLLVGYKCGLNLEQMIDLLKGGAANSAQWLNQIRSLNIYGMRIVNGDMNPGFYVEHFLKDLGIALDEARRMNLTLPGLALAAQLYNSLLAHGKGKLGTQALILTLQELSNVDIWKKSE